MLCNKHVAAKAFDRRYTGIDAASPLEREEEEEIISTGKVALEIILMKVASQNTGMFERKSLRALANRCGEHV